MPRMSILNTEEKEAFDSPPIFNSVQRKRFFSLTSRVASILETLRTPTNKVCFVVSLGYFKATKRFFGRQFRHQDIEDVTRKLGFLPWLIETESYSETTSRRHQKLIRDLLGFRQFEEQEKQFIAREIRTMVRSQSRPKFILLQVLQILENRKTEIPSVWLLSELILDEIKRHKRELTMAMERHLSQPTREFLDALLEKSQEDDEGDPKWQRSKLALMKRISQSTKPSKVKATVEDFKTLRSLYRDLEPVIESLDLTHEGVRYYANSVIKSRVFQISQRSISHQINESELENTVNWYFSKENIDVANDRILRLMDQLELPEVYRNQSGVLHTSSDGQKFEVAVDSLNANYSFKYFGQSKGVSAYNFIDERHFLFHSTVISSAEREAAYVIDGLMHNDVVKSDIHSTDTHGYSEIIFGVMHLLGFSFAPRLRKLKSQRLYRRQELIEAVKSGSVVAWQHINLHGEYDFSDEKLQDSVGLETPKILELSLT